MVMQDSATPRETHVLVARRLRPAWREGGAGSARCACRLFPPGLPNNRLGLARWLVDPSNPLTARVAVNRLWQMDFGVGLVKTVEDFGSQGEWPSNPELLDWLATEFVEQRLGHEGAAEDHRDERDLPAVVEGDARADAEGSGEPPAGARSAGAALRRRWCAINALSVSGLLVDKIGGPSVKPYQPAGLWKELSGGDDYKQDHGDALYRRSLYTFWKRTAPPPMMMSFDAAGREACVVRELRTNTPMQSLNLMNDVTFLEAARKMAERMMRDGGSTPAERIGYGFELATAHQPSQRELEILLASFAYYRDGFQSDAASATSIWRRAKRARDTKLNAQELAAYTARGERHPESGCDTHKGLGMSWQSETQTSHTPVFLRQRLRRTGRRGALRPAGRRFAGSGRSTEGSAGPASLRAYREASHLSLPVGRAVADGSLRLQAAPHGSGQDRSCRNPCAWGSG